MKCFTFETSKINQYHKLIQIFYIKRVWFTLKIRFSLREKREIRMNECEHDFQCFALTFIALDGRTKMTLEGDAQQRSTDQRKVSP